MEENDLLLDFWDDEQSSTNTPSIDIDFWDDSSKESNNKNEESKKKLKLMNKMFKIKQLI